MKCVVHLCFLDCHVDVELINVQPHELINIYGV